MSGSLRSSNRTTLEHIKGMTQLQSLELGGTKATDAGMKGLQARATKTAF